MSSFWGIFILFFSFQFIFSFLGFNCSNKSIFIRSRKEMHVRHECLQSSIAPDNEKKCRLENFETLSQSVCLFELQIAVIWMVEVQLGKFEGNFEYLEGNFIWKCREEIHLPFQTVFDVGFFLLVSYLG